MLRLLGRALLLAALAAPAAADTTIRPLPLSGLKYSIERIGSFSYVHCLDPRREDCAVFEKLQIQIDLDWDTLRARAKKSSRRKPAGPLPVLAKADAVDQHGGLWTVALLPAHSGRPLDGLGRLTYVIVPDFAGYRATLDEDGAILDVDVLDEPAATGPPAATASTGPKSTGSAP